MSEHRVPQWHPMDALPMIGQAIDGMLESAEDVVQSLEQARPRPHVLDDSTIGRVREAHGTQLNDLWWYAEQLARWRRASPTPAQAQELERLTQQLAALRRVLTASLAFAEELQAGTIEKVLAKDDVELAVEYLLGKRKPSPDGCDASPVTMRVPSFSHTSKAHKTTREKSRDIVTISLCPYGALRQAFTLDKPGL